MRERLLSHWKAIAGALLSLPGAWAALKWLLDWGGRIDVFRSWGGWLMDALSNVPPAANLVLLVAGLLLIWWDLKRSSVTAAGPKTVPIERAIEALKWPIVSKWMTPWEAIQEFGDDNLKQDTIAAQEKVNALAAKRAKLIAEQKPTMDIIGSELSSIDKIMALRETSEPLSENERRQNDASIKLAVAHDALKKDLIRQLKGGTLAGRAVISEDKTLHGEWTYLKPAHWATLQFVYSDHQLESVSGGGRTFKGLQIGKVESRASEAS